MAQKQQSFRKEPFKKILLKGQLKSNWTLKKLLEHIKGVGNPQNVRISSKSVRIPLKSVRIPSKSVRIPLKSVRIPSKSVRIQPK
jgi:hypothetical protein